MSAFFLISQLYNDQTITTTIKHTASSPNLQSSYDYDKNNLIVYVFTDNRSVGALSKNGNISNGASGAGFAQSSDNSHGPRGPELSYIPGVVRQHGQPAFSNAHKTT